MTDISSLILPGTYTAIYIAEPAGISMPQEAMEEVSDLENGNPRYTVYQVAEDSKQNLDMDTVPVFEYQVHGAGGWSDFTANQIREIQYPGARLVLNTPMNNDDIVRVKTGKYLAKTQIYGALSTKIVDKSKMDNITPLGARCIRNIPVIDEFNLSMDIFLYKLNAQLVANDLTLTHRLGGIDGNAITYVVTKGTDSIFGIVVSGNAIAVTLATTGTTVTTTNAQLRDALNADPFIRRLGVIAECEFADQGDLATTFSVQNLAGGVDVVKYADKKSNKIIFEVYLDTDTNIRIHGYGYIESIDSPIDIGVAKQSLTISSYGKMFFRDR